MKIQPVPKVELKNLDIDREEVYNLKNGKPIGTLKNFAEILRKEMEKCLKI